MDVMGLPLYPALLNAPNYLRPARRRATLDAMSKWSFISRRYDAHAKRMSQPGTTLRPEASG
jgi:hypothetical protein